MRLKILLTRLATGRVEIKESLFGDSALLNIFLSHFFVNFLQKRLLLDGVDGIEVDADDQSDNGGEEHMTALVPSVNVFHPLLVDALHFLHESSLSFRKGGDIDGRRHPRRFARRCRQ